MFIYSPELLLTNVTNWFSFGIAVVTACVGVFSLAIATEGYALGPVSLPLRLVALAAAILLIVPGIVTDAVGIGLLALVIVLSRRSVTAGTGR